jgi:hypothetical protein
MWLQADQTVAAIGVIVGGFLAYFIWAAYLKPKI